MGKGLMTTDQMIEVGERETFGIANENDRQDAVQEFCLGALTAGARDKDQDSVRALQWAYGRGYVKNFLTFEKRHNYGNNRHVNVHASVEEETGVTWLDGIASKEPGPLEALEHKEAIEKVYEALETLSEQERQIIESRYFNGLKFHEIAQLLQISKQRVEQVEKQALHRLGFVLSL